jgi:WD40 repeat protein
LTALAFDPSGHWIVSGHLLRGAAFWALDGRYPYTIGQHEDDVRSITFTDDGQRLVSSSDDGTVRVWPVSPAISDRGRWLVGDRASALMAIDPVSHRIAMTRGGHVSLLSLDGGSPRDLPGSFSDYKGIAVAFDDEGRLLAAAGGPPMTVRVWNLETGTLWSLVVPPAVGGGGDVHFEQLRFLGPDCLLVGGWTYTPHRSADPGLLRVDLRDGTVRVVGPAPNGSFALSHGKEFGIGVHNRTPPMIDQSGLVRFTIAGGPPVPLPAHGSNVVSVALDPTDSLVATGSDDGTVRVGRVSGEEPHVLLSHHGAVWAVAFSPDGRWLASGGADRTIRLWPVPDIASTPLHKRPYDQFLASIRSHTNVRAVPDPQSTTGWKLEAGPFLGWANPPQQ